MAKAKNETVVVVNTGLSVIYINRERVMPDESIEVAAEFLDLPSFKNMFLKGQMAIKNDADATAEIVRKLKSGAKQDSDAGKTKAQLEDGGEF